MKKFLTLLLAAGMMFSAANSASAIEYNVSGAMDFTFDWTGNVTGGAFMSDSDYAHNYGPNTFEDRGYQPWTGPRANYNYTGRSYQKRNSAMQRLRIGVDIVASESLRAHYMVQVGEFTWGGDDNRGNHLSGGRLGSRARNISTHLAYLDWMIPCTSAQVRMGLMPIGMPSYTFGSPVLDARATGITVTIPVTDNITITPLWLRTLDNTRDSATDGSLFSDYDDRADIFGLVNTFRFDGWSASLYGLYGKMGSDFRDNSGNQNKLFPVWASNGTPYDYDLAGDPLFYNNNLRGDSTYWTVGLGAELTMFDPFRFTFDFAYGKADNETTYHALNSPEWVFNPFAEGIPYSRRYSSSIDDRAGWYAALGAEYKFSQANLGVLGLKGWYASGDDDDPFNGSEQMPALKGGFNATNLYHDGAFGLARGFARNDASGTWGVQLKWSGVSFIDKLSHELAVTYVKGTNDVDNLYAPTTMYNGFALPVHRAMVDADPSSYMTNKDSFIEIDFNHRYQMYQNLAVVLELSYIIEDFDGSAWGKSYGIQHPFAQNVFGGVPVYDKAKFSNMWRAAINFKYTF